MNDKAFLGKGWSFPPEFRKKNNATSLVKEEEDIKQSLHILLETTPGERIHRYDFGCGIKKFAYEAMTITTQTLMQDTIRQAILNFEPRIILNNLYFNMEQAAEGIMYIELDYTVRTTNNRSNLVYPFYLREGTDIDL